MRRTLMDLALLAASLQAGDPTTSPNSSFAALKKAYKDATKAYNDEFKASFDAAKAKGDAALKAFKFEAQPRPGHAFALKFLAVAEGPRGARLRRRSLKLAMQCSSSDWSNAPEIRGQGDQDPPGHYVTKARSRVRPPVAHDGRSPALRKVLVTSSPATPTARSRPRPTRP